MDTSLTWLGRLATAPSGPDWRRLVDGYAPLLRGWLARAGVPASEYDDLVQEVLLVVFRRVAEFDRRGAGAFRGWLRGVLANHVRKYFRDRPAASAVDPDELAADDSVLAKAWDREHDEYLAARALRAVEGDFTPATWQAFRRQVFARRTAADAAAELGLSVNAALLAKSRVLKRLREELRGLVG